MSTPITHPSDPTMRTAIRLSMPAPLPTSTTRSLGCRILSPPPKTLTLVLLAPYCAKITKSRETSLGFSRCGRISGCTELLEDLLGFCLDERCCLKVARCPTHEPDGGSSGQAACGFV